MAAMLGDVDSKLRHTSAALSDTDQTKALS